MLVRVQVLLLATRCLAMCSENAKRALLRAATVAVVAILVLGATGCGDSSSESGSGPNARLVGTGLLVNLSPARSSRDGVVGRSRELAVTPFAEVRGDHDVKRVCGRSQTVLVNQDEIPIGTRNDRHSTLTSEDSTRSSLVSLVGHMFQAASAQDTWASVAKRLNAAGIEASEAALQKYDAHVVVADSDC